MDSRIWPTWLPLRGGVLLAGKMPKITETSPLEFEFNFKTLPISRAHLRFGALFSFERDGKLGMLGNFEGFSAGNNALDVSADYPSENEGEKSRFQVEHSD
jgi:hypothetical protein